jgi:hypothetical protein
VQRYNNNLNKKNKNEKNDGFTCFLREIMVILQTDTVLFLFCKKTKAGQ